MPPPGCFACVAGDFDGQGISFGALQFNLGQETLQPILAELDRRHPALMEEIFADRAYLDDGNLVPRSQPGALNGSSAKLFSLRPR